MIIGITTTLNEADGYQRVNVEYINRIATLGAVPLLLTPVRGGAEKNRQLAHEVIDLVDALVITGGGDIHPRYYVPEPDLDSDNIRLSALGHTGCGSASRCMSTGQEVPFCGHFVCDTAFEKAMGTLPDTGEVHVLDGRDVASAADAVRIPCLDGLMAVSEDRDGFELELAQLAHERNIPCLGICRGMQVMNVALGGSLYRDLYNCGVTKHVHLQEPPYNRTTDEVSITKGTLLAHALNEPEHTVATEAVNSMHHQGIDHVAEPLTVSARSYDGIVEAVEDPTKNFYLGVQWHPEYLDHHVGIFQELYAVSLALAKQAK